MNEHAISINSVSKYYKLYKDKTHRLKEALHPLGKKYHQDFYAIQDLSLDIRKGEVLGIVGRNGCGKSTLLKLIAGVLKPNHGNIVVDGKVTALLELGAGFNPEFTGRENIMFYSAILGLGSKRIAEITPAIIDFAELGEFIDQPLKTFSSGMKSRLGFAVACHVEPEILILDEVLAVGDALFKRKCYAKMEEFFKSGKTVLYVSHDASSVNQLCNRAILIDSGVVVMDGIPAEVTKYYEKLLFAKDHDKEKVLEEISRAPKIETKTGGDFLEQEENIRNREDEVKLESYFVKDLKPKSTVVYENSLAQIRNSMIKTIDGKQVNVLVGGHDYEYSYEIEFFESFKSLSFGMKIKTAKGFELAAGSNYLSDYLFKEVKRGETLKIIWRFTCNLLTGEYYTNAGVSEHNGDEFSYVARIVDNLVFRVITPKYYLPKGFVDLGQKLKVERNDRQIFQMNVYGQTTCQ